MKLKEFLETSDVGYIQVCLDTHNHIFGVFDKNMMEYEANGFYAHLMSNTPSERLKPYLDTNIKTIRLTDGKGYSFMHNIVCLVLDTTSSDKTASDTVQKEEPDACTKQIDEEIAYLRSIMLQSLEKQQSINPNFKEENINAIAYKFCSIAIIEEFKLSYDKPFIMDKYAGYHWTVEPTLIPTNNKLKYVWLAVHHPHADPRCTYFSSKKIAEKCADMLNGKQLPNIKKNKGDQ